MASKSRAWCFTHNNYTEDDIKFWENFNCKYIIYGKEVAPTTGTPHLQGYFRLEIQITFKALKKKLPKDVAFFAANGTFEQNRTYCTKQDGIEYYERGERPAQGRRSDLDAVRAMAAEHGIGAVTTHFNHQAIQTAKAYLTYNEPERDWKPYVQWFWGEPGTGKTKEARRILPKNNPDKERPQTFTHNGSKWWDGYDAHPYVIIDDVRPETISFIELLKVLDRYPHRVEVKGGYRQLLARHIILTSSKHPCNMYQHTGENLNQLTRRIDEIREFTAPIENSSEVNSSEVTGNISRDQPDLDQWLSDMLSQM